MLIKKKEWNNAICSNNVDKPGEYHTKWRQRKTIIIWHHLYVESKKKNYTSKLYLQNINRLTELTDLQNKSMVSRGKGRGEDWEFGIDM